MNTAFVACSIISFLSVVANSVPLAGYSPLGESENVVIIPYNICNSKYDFNYSLEVLRRSNFPKNLFEQCVDANTRFICDVLFSAFSSLCRIKILTRELELKLDTMQVDTHTDVCGAASLMNSSLPGIIKMLPADQQSKSILQHIVTDPLFCRFACDSDKQHLCMLMVQAVQLVVSEAADQLKQPNGEKMDQSHKLDAAGPAQESSSITATDDGEKTKVKPISGYRPGPAKPYRSQTGIGTEGTGVASGDLNSSHRKDSRYLDSQVSTSISQASRGIGDVVPPNTTPVERLNLPAKAEANKVEKVAPILPQEGISKPLVAINNGSIGKIPVPLSSNELGEPTMSSDSQKDKSLGSTTVATIPVSSSMATVRETTSTNKGKDVSSGSDGNSEGSTTVQKDEQDKDMKDSENGETKEMQKHPEGSGQDSPKLQQDLNRISPGLPVQEDGHFFVYFLMIVAICILSYLVFHNKQKIIALIIEGRHERRRRPSVGGYKKLDPHGEGKGSHSVF